MTEAIAGVATPEGTRAYCANQGRELQPAGGVTLGRTGLHVAGVGFGGYRVSDDSPLHAAALTQALRSGVNLIDTSANYGDGASERLIGRVLGELIAAGELTREQVTVVTKAGYIQGENLKLARARAAEGRPFDEVVKLGEDLWHCIHPDYLEDQLRRSLTRLGLTAVDVYLLHNPEYYLEAAEREGRDREDAREKYLDRLAEAFAWLETKARAGVIGWYGVSSNTFASPERAYALTSLDHCLELAHDLAPDHHFAVIELPANLYEHGAWTERNHAAGSETVLERAAEAGVGVLANRPFNALYQGHLIRLTDPPRDLEPRRAAVQDQLDALTQLELQARTLLERSLGQAGAEPPLNLAPLLTQAWPNYTDGVSWELFIGRELVPRAREEFTRLAGQLGGMFGQLSKYYLDELNRTLHVMGEYFQVAGRPRQDYIHAALRGIVPDELEAAPLSQKVIWTLRSLPGISSVLVGMRRPEYVEDALTATRVTPGQLTPAQTAQCRQALIKEA